MTAVERIRPCLECGRLTRPSTESPRDYPGTLVRGAKDYCMTCYRHRRPEPVVPAPRRPVYDVVFAVVPDPRHGQQSDCRPSCCRNPYLCRTGFRCACHQEAR